MKPAGRLDSRISIVRHFLYGKAGEPLRADRQEIDDIHPAPVEFSQDHACHELTMAANYDPLSSDDRVWEIVFSGRGQIGGGIDLMFQDVGLWVSRALQNRDPMTGEENARLQP